MGLSDFTTVTITSATRTPTRVGFGTPLVAGYFTAWTDRIRTYQNIDALVADGIVSTGVGAATYWAVSAIFAQNPRVAQVKVGRRTNAWTQKMQLIVTTATAGTTYRFTIGPLGGSATTFTRTVPGSSTIAAEAAAIKVLIDAAGFAMTTAVVGGTTVECTASMAGTMFVYTARNVELELFESTAAPAGLSADLDSFRTADDDWYDFTLDSNSKAEVLIAAAWTEPQFKVYFEATGDTENGKIGVASTLLKQLKALTYARTSTWMDSAAVPSFLAPAILGEEAPYDPGIAPGTYLGKSVAAVVVDSLSATAEGEVVTQNGNVYTLVDGLNVTRPGKAASGDFIDVVRGRDWLVARLKEAVFSIIAGSRRVPYTDGGVATLVAAVSGVLIRAQGSKTRPGFLDPEVAVIVTAPLVKDVDPANRAARIFPGISFSAKIAGAIHNVPFTGTIYP